MKIKFIAVSLILLVVGTAQALGQKPSQNATIVSYPSNILTYIDGSVKKQKIENESFFDNANILFVISMKNKKLTEKIAELNNLLNKNEFDGANIVLVIQDPDMEKIGKIKRVNEKCRVIVDDNFWIKDLGMDVAENAMLGFFYDKKGNVEFFCQVFYEEALLILKKEIAKRNKKK